jgi:hypothetical protein
MIVEIIINLLQVAKLSMVLQLVVLVFMDSQVNLVTLDTIMVHIIQHSVTQEFMDSQQLHVAANKI